MPNKSVQLKHTEFERQQMTIDWKKEEYRKLFSNFWNNQIMWNVEQMIYAHFLLSRANFFVAYIKSTKGYFQETRPPERILPMKTKGRRIHRRKTVRSGWK